MARIKIPSTAMTDDQLKHEIDRWADSEEMRNLAFLKAICQAFQTNVEKYYKAGPTLTDRSQRLEEIRRALIEIGFKDSEHTFTIAAATQVCPDGRPSTGGICP